MATRNGGRIYWRERGGEARAYGDFRDYAAEGGGREALVPDGAKRATTDPDVAEALAANRLQELQELRQRRVVTGVRRVEGLESFGSFHMKAKVKAGVSEKWLVAVENQLARAVAFFGKDRELTTIRPSDVRQWIAVLRQTENGRGGTLTEKTVRDHLNSLSNLYRRAQQEEAVPPGFNPVSALIDKPVPERQEREDWLEPAEAALLLEAARTYSPPDSARGHDAIHEMIATALLTGLRKSELLGLTVEDVSFDAGLVRVRPNAYRGLKTKRSRRTVPLWPQLREILQAYIFLGGGPKDGLLFPSPRGGGMMRECRKQLDTVGKRAGFEAGRVRWHMLRHTYTAARIQTYDVVRRPGPDGESQEIPVPVSLYTVARELGHSSTRLIEERYGHLAQRPDRRPEVAFRAESYREELGERLSALQVAR